MMRRDNQKPVLDLDQDVHPEDGYFTYRPLSSLPTPPPSSRDSTASHSPTSSLADGESLDPKLRGKLTMPCSGAQAVLPALLVSRSLSI